MDSPKEMQLISVKQDVWAKWKILQDNPDEAPVSIAELLTDKWEDMELGEIDDRLVASSVAYHKCMELVLDMPGRPAMGRNPLVDFQLIDYK